MRGGVVERIDSKSPKPRAPNPNYYFSNLGVLKPLSGAVDCGVGVSQAGGSCFAFNVRSLNPKP